MVLAMIKCEKCKKLKHPAFIRRFGKDKQIRHKCNNCILDDNLYSRYRLTKAEFNSMWFEQDGKCLGCKESTKLVVDHSHGTKKVRGLLCNDCNSALGFVKEQKRILLSLVRYLDNTK